MHRRPLAAAAAALVLLAIPLTAVPASASTAVRVKALHEPSVYEGYYTVIEYQYSCAPGTTITVAATIDQPSTGAFYGSRWSTDPVHGALCDGAKHTTSIGAVSPGYTEAGAAEYEAPYLRDSLCETGAPPTSCAASRGTVTVTVVDSRGRSDTDTTRVDVVSRDYVGED